MAKIGEREAQLRQIRESNMAKQYTPQLFRQMSAAERRVQQGEQRRRIKEEDARNTKVFGPPVKPMGFASALKTRKGK
jgi:hypothetical protein